MEIEADDPQMSRPGGDAGRRTASGRPSCKRGPTLPRLFTVRSLLLGLPLLALMCAGAQGAESLVLQTEAGRFSLRLTGIERRERVNHLHGFECSLTTADGKPAAGASLVLTGQHRYALNPLPTLPHAVPGPVDGTYRIEGLRFHVVGEWDLMLEIEFRQIRDRATFHVDVN